MVTVSGRSGLTKAYVSVLSASGSWLMRGASRWLDARAAGTAGERSSAPRPSAVHAPMTDRDGALPFDVMCPSCRPPTLTDAGTGTDLGTWVDTRAVRGERGVRAATVPRSSARAARRPRYGSTAYTSTGAATPFRGTAPQGRRTRPFVSPSAARVDSVKRIGAPRSRVFTCRRAAWFTASPTMV